MKEITINLDPIDVGCETCGADIGVPCRGVKTFHRDRLTYRKELIEKCTGNSDSARWWRWRVGKRGVPRVNLPHGTHAAYQRHKRDGTEPCQPCIEAARDTWREADKKRPGRARKADINDDLGLSESAALAEELGLV